METSLHDPIKLRRRPIEDILDAALEHGDVGVVEFVLDVLRVELDAAEIFLVEDGRGRARGRDRQFASIDVPAKPLRHGAGAKRAIRHPEAASIETGVEEGISWAFYLALHPDDERSTLLVVRGDRLSPPAPSAVALRVAEHRALLRAAMLIERLVRSNRRLSRDLRRSRLFGAIDEPPEEAPAIVLEHPAREPLDDLFPEIIAESAAMRSVLLSVAELAQTDIPILIEGESGTGKELVANAVHRLSPRRNGPFVSENCAAIPESLFESEVFGFERGAFTGAERAKAGLVERAHRGTLFLDEVGELDLSQQRKLLRVLQEREVRRLGGGSTSPVDFRLISATNRVLGDLVIEGAFREDLYYRLQAATIALPPLRERVEDIPPLVELFNRRFAAKLEREPLDFGENVRERLAAYGWPGNIRELHNEIWRLVATVRGEVTPEDLARPIRDAIPLRGRTLDASPQPLAELERRVIGGAIREAILATGGNLALAARRLGVPRTTLYRKLERYGIRWDDARSS